MAQLHSGKMPQSRMRLALWCARHLQATRRINAAPCDGVSGG
jgi:hypothetical protein